MSNKKARQPRINLDLDTPPSPAAVRAVLWQIASDGKQSGATRTRACQLLLDDAGRGGSDGANGADALNIRAAAMLRRVPS
jgi:hypothetical protein